MTLYLLLVIEVFMNKLISIYIVVFLDMLGIGIMIPVIRDFTEFLVIESGYKTTNYATFAGVLMASYSLFQFFFAPILGRLSDIFGRKRVLQLSIIGNVISYFIWAITSNYVIFLFSRIISGMTGGNISVAQSYIADATNSSNRAKYMGLFGAVLGIGFIVGPFLGGIFSMIDLTMYSTGMIKFNPYSFIGVATMGLSIINLIWVQLSVHNIRKEQFIHEKWYRLKISGMQAVRSKGLKLIIVSYFFLSLGFMHIEATLAWDLKDRFELNTENTGYYFAFMGLIMALVQGGIYRILLKKYSINKILNIGLISLSIGMFLMIMKIHLLYTAIVTVVLAFGMGISSPSYLTITSNSANEEEQGITLGVLHSFGSLARIIAPISATLMYDHIGEIYPYIASGLIIIIAMIIINRADAKD